MQAVLTKKLFTAYVTQDQISYIHLCKVSSGFYIFISINQVTFSFSISCLEFLDKMNINLPFLSFSTNISHLIVLNTFNYNEPDNQQQTGWYRLVVRMTSHNCRRIKRSLLKSRNKSGNVACFNSACCLPSGLTYQSLLGLYQTEHGKVTFFFRVWCAIVFSE